LCPGFRNGVFCLLRGEAAPGRKTSSGWPLLRILRRTRTDQAHSTGALEAYGLNEDGAIPLDPLSPMEDNGMTHSVITEAVGPLSHGHATIVGAMGDQTHCSTLISRKCHLGKHEVRHEFLCLPNCPVVLMHRDLCKLRAQITFDSDGISAIKLRGPEANILTLTCMQEEEW
jgi:hypothetical protein